MKLIASLLVVLMVVDVAQGACGPSTNPFNTDAFAFDAYQKRTDSTTPDPDDYGWTISLCSPTIPKGASGCNTPAFVTQTKLGACSDQLNCVMDKLDSASAQGNQVIFNFRSSKATDSGGVYKAIVTIDCDASVGNALAFSGTNVIASQNADGAYTWSFSMKSGCACSGGCSASSGGGWGLIVIILLIVGLVVYFAGGFAFNYKKRELRGAEAVPHLEFWKDLPILVKDGFFFVFGRFCNRSYSSV
jgi:hypothetical protein